MPAFATALPTVKTATAPAAVKRPFENVASRTAALKTKLQAFKNQQKAIIVERLNTNLNVINQNQVKQLQKHLNTMTSILDRLTARVNQGTEDIKDPEAAMTAITSARISIATASAAVSAQTQKDFTIAVTLETRIRADAKKQRDNLHTDLLEIRKMVVDAKQQVANAIRVSRKEATASGQQ